MSGQAGRARYYGKLRNCVTNTPSFPRRRTRFRARPSVFVESRWVPAFAGTTTS